MTRKLCEQKHGEYIKLIDGESYHIENASVRHVERTKCTICQSIIIKREYQCDLNKQRFEVKFIYK